MPYRVPTVLELSEGERSALAGRARRRTAEGLNHTAIAAALGLAKPTVGKGCWRFARDRLEGPRDEPRCGVPRTGTDERVAEPLVRTLETTPENAMHWSTRSMAAACGLSPATVQRSGAPSG